MKQFEFITCPIIDCHIHYSDISLMPELIKLCETLGVQKINIVCTPNVERLSLLPDALHLKAHYPEKVYVFGCLDISALFVEPKRAGHVFADYVDTLMGLGCDGIKMIEGKPQIRSMLPMPAFDSNIYAPYWERMEDRQIPLLFHVNDPEEFWDADKVPQWAVDHGWFYGNGDYINNEAQYQEVLNVLSRHKELNVIFPHFFFLSAQLERLARYLDEYPNMHIDLTPGIEMYINFSKHLEDAREFFITYQDRIMFGTDIGAKTLLDTPDEGIDRLESQERTFLVRRFLEDSQEFVIDGSSGFLFGESEVRLTGLGLPKSVLDKIYFKNFESFVGIAPKPLVPSAITRECDRLAVTIEMMGAAQPGMSTDASVAKKVRNFFQSKMNR
jgi:hypothetical protein